MIFTLQTQRNWFCNWYYKNINIRFHFIWQKTGTDVTLFYKMHYIEEVVLDNQPYIVCGKQLQWIILIIKIIKTFADFRLHSAKERFSNLIRQLYVFCRFVVVIFHLSGQVSIYFIQCPTITYYFSSNSTDFCLFRCSFIMC